jgi:hypothetical protein
MNSRLALVFGIIFVVMASAATSQKTSANYPWLMVFLSKFSDRKDGVGPARPSLSSLDGRAGWLFQYMNSNHYIRRMDTWMDGVSRCAISPVV